MCLIVCWCSSFRLVFDVRCILYYYIIHTLLYIIHYTYIIIYYILYIYYYILYYTLPNILSSSFPFSPFLPLLLSKSIFSYSLLPFPNLSSVLFSLLFLYNHLIQSIRVGTYSRLFIFNPHPSFPEFDPACFIGGECRVVQFDKYVFVFEVLSWCSCWMF